MNRRPSNITDYLQQALSCIAVNNMHDLTKNTIVSKILSVYSMILDPNLSLPNATIIRIDNNLDTDTNRLEQIIQSTCECAYLKSVLSYFISELTCNIEQHADVPLGYGIVHYDDINNTLFVGIADGGISIFGSYARVKKYQSLIGDSEAQALYLAQNGYSTKNLPNAENRGYGISSNAKIIVDGLGGVFSIISGNALYFRSQKTKQIITLPNNVDWPGTLVLVEIPLTNQSINLYDYIS